MSPELEENARLVFSFAVSDGHVRCQTHLGKVIGGHLSRRLHSSECLRPQPFNQPTLIDVENMEWGGLL